MRTQPLGTGGFDVSEIGLGCWQLGGDWGDSPPDARKAREILEAAAEAGVTFFDTADVYGDGRSERALGAFLATTEHPVHVATKFGRAAGVYPDGYTRDAIRRAAESSRERLGVDALDLLQLHCIPTEVMRRGEVFDWLRELHDDGVIRHFGASVETIEEGLLCLEQEGLQSLQVILNVLRPQPLEELVPKAALRGVGIIARVPLASGVLSGKFVPDVSPQAAFAKNDHRNFNSDGKAFNVGETFGGLPFGEAVELVRELQREFVPEGMPTARFALRWLLDQPGVTTVIPGASSWRQAQANAGAAEIEPLDEGLLERVTAWSRERAAGLVRGAV